VRFEPRSLPRVRRIMFAVASSLVALGVPATSTSKAMYAWQCDKEPSSLICQHHSLVQQMLAEKDREARKPIQTKIQALVKSRPTGTPSISEQYAAMKLAYCATSPEGAKALCSTAASQFKTAGSASRKPGAPMTPSSSSYSDVATWYCAKPKNEEEPMCKRAAVLKQLRAPGVTAEQRKELLDKLKGAPMVYATTQAIYADYCKIEEHAAKPTCTRLKHTHATRTMREWYCAQPAGQAGMWCKRQALLDRLQKIPSSSTDPGQKEARTKLSKEFAAFSKRPEGGGAPPSAGIAKEITDAKKSYCAIETNKEIVICKASMAGAARAGLARPSALG